MSDETYWIIACKVWEQKASAQEEAQLDTWVQQEGNAQKLAKFRRVWEITAASGVPTFDAADSWNELESRLALPAKTRTIQLFPLLSKIAASLLLLIAAYFYLPSLWSGEQLSMQTRAGEQKLVILPDSTHVWLNAGSTLHYPETFTDSRRLVSLEGEAFFDVTKDHTRPFIIQTASTETKVLGTSFNIRALSDRPVTVTVATGKVQFGPLDDQRKVVLLPGDAGTFDPNQQALNSKPNNDPRFLEWRNRTLVFTKTSLARVFQTLEEAYDIHIDAMDRGPWTVDSPCVFTGTFENTPEKEILEVLSASIGFEWSATTNGHYTISNISCQ
jgi:ferric-dicitrate binding protein FerR (iron transport regulator)